MNDLEKYREQLGFCDDKIIDALVERNSIIEKMKNSKRIQARKLFDYNIVLIGFMGAGKSSVSEYLSAVFAMKVVEMDQVIANREQMSIPDIFDAYGEEIGRASCRERVSLR